MAGNQALPDLISLGKEILNPECEAEARISKVEEYTKYFDKWYESFQSAITTEITEGEKQLLSELSEVHTEVLEVASRMKGDTVNKLNELKRKGRGIRAYAKNMPGGEFGGRDVGTRPVRKS